MEKQFIFIDTNVFILYIECKNIRKQIQDILETPNSIFLTTDIVKKEIEMWGDEYKQRQNTDFNKIIELIESDKFIKIKVKKEHCDESWTRDFLNFPPHRTDMNKPEYPHNHRDTVNWLTIMEYVKTNGSNSSITKYYTNDRDFQIYKTCLSDEWLINSKGKIIFEHVLSFQAYRDWISKDDSFRFDSWQINLDWFFYFNSLLDKPKNIEEWFVSILIFVSTTKHPVSYIINYYESNKRFFSSGDEFIITFYRKLISFKDKVILKKIIPEKKKELPTSNPEDYYVKLKIKLGIN